MSVFADPVVTIDSRVIEAAVVDSDEQVQAFARWEPPATAGAWVTFSGVVRDHDGGRGVRELEYEGHPSAEQVLLGIAEEVAADYPEVLGVRVVHRVGALAIGDCALLAQVCSAHRAEAFAACSDLVDRVKKMLPVWKRQVFADGSQEWVNCP